MIKAGEGRAMQKALFRVLNHARHLLAGISPTCCFASIKPAHVAGQKVAESHVLLFHLCFDVGLQIAKSIFYGLGSRRASGPTAAVLAAVKRAA